MFEHILSNQLGNIDWEARHKTIQEYHERTGGYKCPRCGNEKIGITYTTGTGACSNCKSNLILTSSGIVAMIREGPDKAWCHFWSTSKDWICKKCPNMAWGPALCGQIDSIYL